MQPAVGARDEEHGLQPDRVCGAVGQHRPRRGVVHHGTGRPVPWLPQGQDLAAGGAEQDVVASPGGLQAKRFGFLEL